MYTAEGPAHGLHMAPFGHGGQEVRVGDIAGKDGAGAERRRRLQLRRGEHRLTGGGGLVAIVEADPHALQVLAHASGVLGELVGVLGAVREVEDRDARAGAREHRLGRHDQR